MGGTVRHEHTNQRASYASRSAMTDVDLARAI